jgi:Transposase domain (DUF772)
MHNLSDEALCERWVENPYFQYFCGETVFASRAVELGRFCHGALCQEEPRPVPGNITIHTLNLAVSRPMGLGFLLAYEGSFVEIEPGTSADQGKAEARERLGHQRRVVAAIIELGDVLIGGIAHY